MQAQVSFGGLGRGGSGLRRGGGVLDVAGVGPGLHVWAFMCRHAFMFEPFMYRHACMCSHT